MSAVRRRLLRLRERSSDHERDRWPSGNERDGPTPHPLASRHLLPQGEKGTPPEGNAMLRAETVIPAGGWSGEPVDSVVLDFDERHRRRVAMTGVRGLDFLLDLPEAVALRAGDGLAARRWARRRGRRRARAAGRNSRRRPGGADAHRLAFRQSPSADRTPEEEPAHSPGSGDRGDGAGPGRAGRRDRSAVQPGRRRLCARAGGPARA